MNILPQCSGGHSLEAGVFGLAAESHFESRPPHAFTAQSKPFMMGHPNPLKEREYCRGHLKRSLTPVKGWATVYVSPPRKKPKHTWPNFPWYGTLGLSNHPIRSITAGRMGGSFVRISPPSHSASGSPSSSPNSVRGVHAVEIFEARATILFNDFNYRTSRHGFAKAGFPARTARIQQTPFDASRAVLVLS